jgi:hypothetical protein
MSSTALATTPTAFAGFVGTWVTVDCATTPEGDVDCDTSGDGSAMSMIIASGDRPSVTFQDSFATFCDGNGSRATRFVANGVGTYDGDFLWVDFANGGCGAVTTGALTFQLYHDPGSDTLWEDEDGDGLGYIWHRAAPSTPSSALGSVTPLRWHRLNIHEDPPEHERFSCLTDAAWRCRYDKLPDPQSELSWDTTHGTFTGTVTNDFACPAWFPTATCDAGDMVVVGTGAFTPADGDPFEVDQALLVSNDGRLFVYWVDQFVCPWYPTFERALMNDDSCTFAP